MPALFRDAWPTEVLGKFDERPTEAARAIVLGAAEWVPELDTAALMGGKAVEDAAADTAETERPFAAAEGGGTKGVGFFAGSSKVGAGNTGWEEARPVPDGPPLPVLRRGAPPAAPLAALRACWTICCCRASTSRPDVT